MMKKWKIFLTGCVVAVLTAGCGASLAPQLYSLNPVAKPAGPAMNISVTVGPVSVPDAVDRPQLVLNIAPNQLRVDEFNRWSAPLKGDIARVVAENLAVLLGSPYVAVFPRTVSLSPAYRVTIDVVRFESVPGEAVRMNALWAVRATADGTVRQGGATLQEPLRGAAPADLVAAHSRMLGVLSGDIAAAIRGLAVTARKEAPAARQ
ncbi:MAG TPA: PqiC family protein [Syntrophales bacterium]|jgi:hypothetical protein|nr:PqiC family protein [Syntrophales bacterium]HON23337.1 PqiC family protein [Syntrophales bacterium]HOU77333.1 PqiC family protein [Syntrophales bacterium]HPC32664.1 PqiC family protein [Syntrophales bacterium]HQG33978.1 PqiC family protein [Syntrophales bacterium]